MNSVGQFLSPVLDRMQVTKAITARGERRRTHRGAAANVRSCPCASAITLLVSLMNANLPAPKFPDEPKFGMHTMMLVSSPDARVPNLA